MMVGKLSKSQSNIIQIDISNMHLSLKLFYDQRIAKPNDKHAHHQRHRPAATSARCALGPSIGPPPCRSAAPAKYAGLNMARRRSCSARARPAGVSGRAAHRRSHSRRWAARRRGSA